MPQPVSQLCRLVRKRFKKSKKNTVKVKESVNLQKEQRARDLILHNKLHTERVRKQEVIIVR